jgi:hypothetical protein
MPTQRKMQDKHPSIGREHAQDEGVATVARLPLASEDEPSGANSNKPGAQATRGSVDGEQGDVRTSFLTPQLLETMPQNETALVENVDVMAESQTLDEANEEPDPGRNWTA